MRSTFLGFLLCIGILCAWPVCRASDAIHAARVHRRPIDHGVMLRTVYELEQGRWGFLGGRGNMARDTWKDYTSLPYAYSKDPQYAEPIYRAHIDTIIRQFQSYGYRASAADIYSAWRFGFEAAYNFKRAKIRPECLARAQNLYDDFYP